MEKDIITINKACYYDAESFRNAAADCLMLIGDILRLGDDIAPSEIANRAYFLHWLVKDVEIKDEQK